MGEQQQIPAGRWLMIVNPNAGVKKGTRDWPRIIKLLRAEGVDFEFRLTERKAHAIEMAMQGVAGGYRHFCVVGGDGTLNEVVNGLMNQQEVAVSEFVVAIIPVGTGNDWCRMFSIPFDYKEAIAVLKRQKLFLQDVGKVTYQHENETINRYFINVAGMGYDALVAKKTNLLKEKGRGGPMSYFYFIFTGLFQYKFMEAVIEIDGKVFFKGEIFSLNIGICKYNGGGMMQVPAAVADDGLLDLMLIRKASKWIVIRHARKLYDGSLVDLPVVTTGRGKTIRIRSLGKVYLETDGESLGHTPFTFDILPRHLKIVTGG